MPEPRETWRSGAPAVRSRPGGEARLRPSALRYYEQAGLIPPPPRDRGARRYPPATLRRIALIKMAQRAGFRLAEIRALLTHPADSPG